MKLLGWIMVVGGLVMMIIRGVSVNTNNIHNKTSLVEINDDHNLIGWQTYVGGIISIAGIILLASRESSKPNRQTEDRTGYNKN